MALNKQEGHLFTVLELEPEGTMASICDWGWKRSKYWPGHYRYMLASRQTCTCGICRVMRVESAGFCEEQSGTVENL